MHAQGISDHGSPVWLLVSEEQASPDLQLLGIVYCTVFVSGLMMRPQTVCLVSATRMDGSSSVKSHSTTFANVTPSVQRLMSGTMSRNSVLIQLRVSIMYATSSTSTNR